MLEMVTMADALDAYLADTVSLDIDELYSSAEMLLSDDIWKKFELEGEDEELESFLGFTAEEINACDQSSSSTATIRNHDCMWAGHCGSKDHPADEHHKHLMAIIPKMDKPVAHHKPPASKTTPVQSSRSLLLKTKQVVESPDSPPISDDDEEQKGQTMTMKILSDTIDQFEIDEDSDLCEYFEEGIEEAVVEVKEEPEQQPPPLSPSKIFHHMQSDHCYHKDKNASMRMAGLGIETPSDSEEEIDVVSIGDKQSFPIRCGYAFPTNPSNKDRHHFQRTMASITTCGKREPSPKRRGIKRPRKPHKSPQPPYKKRTFVASSNNNNSSDSESEHGKRNLHNNMERQRRIDLRNAFEELRVLVPQVNSKDRAAKVVILREAAVYCDFLGDVSSNLTRKLSDLKRQQDGLRRRVSQLRRNLAAKR